MNNQLTTNNTVYQAILFFYEIDFQHTTGVFSSFEKALQSVAHFENEDFDECLIFKLELDVLNSINQGIFARYSKEEILLKIK